MAEARNRPARDPVCGMQVDEREPAAKASFEGRDYYFCSQSCKEKFEQNPSQYAKGGQE